MTSQRISSFGDLDDLIREIRNDTDLSGGDDLNVFSDKTDTSTMDMLPFNYGSLPINLAGGDTLVDHEMNKFLTDMIENHTSHLMESHTSHLPPEKRAIVKPIKAKPSPPSFINVDQVKPFVPRHQSYFPISPSHVRSLSMSSAAATFSQMDFRHFQMKNQDQGQPKKYTNDYLVELVKDKKELLNIPKSFIHLERLIDEEIAKVQSSLGHLAPQGPLRLPRPEGEVVLLEEKIFVPVLDYPSYNFVGRILGPRGMTAKQLEQETGCKIMIRGKGSVRDKLREDSCRGKPNWEHLDEELHILVQCEDTENRAKIKMQRAVDEVNRMLIPAREGEDELKRKQLMELAIINGNYRPTNQKKIATQTPRLLTPMTLTASLRCSAIADNPFSLGASVNALLSGYCMNFEN